MSSQSSTPIMPRCGQFTFYFSKCGHATTHTYHRVPTLGERICNSNCIYDRKIDYWFWAGKDKRCSFCGLGPHRGFGTQNPIPEDPVQRSLWYGRVKEGMGLDQPNEAWNAFFSEARDWYNQKVMEEIKLREAGEPSLPSPGLLRTQRRLRHENRWDVRRLRARRRTEKWVQNVRNEQYLAVKQNMDFGGRPFITGGAENPYMDLFSKVPIPALPTPIANCTWCQYPLNDIEESGDPYSLPCRHMFHLDCVTGLFRKREEEEEKEICKCPLCKVWFRDLREVPNFYKRYRYLEHEFDSVASSSILTGSVEGDERGDPQPPWIFRPDILVGVPELLGDSFQTDNNLLREIIQELVDHARADTDAKCDRLSPSPIFQGLGPTNIHRLQNTIRQLINTRIQEEVAEKNMLFSQPASGLSMTDLVHLLNHLNSLQATHIAEQADDSLSEELRSVQSSLHLTESSAQVKIENRPLLNIQEKTHLPTQPVSAVASSRRPRMRQELRGRGPSRRNPPRRIRSK